MMMFYKLCRKERSSSAHRTETLTTMGHERSLTASSIRSDQKNQNISLELMACYEMFKMLQWFF